MKNSFVVPPAGEADGMECRRGEGRYRVRAVCRRCGGDLAVAVLGGEYEHVGAVSLALYEPERDSATVSTVAAPGHRDDAVAARFAKELSRRLRCTVSATAGIHIDGATPEEIGILLQNTEQCLSELIARLTGEAGA